MNLDYVLSRKIRDVKEESRWIYLNDMTCNLAKASNKAFEKLKYYSQILKKSQEDNNKVIDKRSDEQIIDDTLNMFK